MNNYLIFYNKVHCFHANWRWQWDIEPVSDCIRCVQKQQTSETHARGEWYGLRRFAYGNQRGFHNLGPKNIFSGGVKRRKPPPTYRASTNASAFWITTHLVDFASLSLSLCLNYLLRQSLTATWMSFMRWVLNFIRHVGLCGWGGIKEPR